MDYEGFRQMVLGANIFPTKSKELTLFSKGDDPTSSTPNKLFEEKKQQERAVMELRQRVEGNSEKHCFNYQDFSRKFTASYSKELSWERAEECYSLTKEQDSSRILKIFSLECEADILVKIVEVFSFIAEFLSKQEESGALHS